MKTLAPLQGWWSSRPPRERRWVVWGAVVVSLYVLWAQVWQPSWVVWREAPAQRAQATSLLQSLQSLRAQAQHWREQAAITAATREAALQSLARAASVKLTAQAPGWRIDFSDWSAEQLSQWLVDVEQEAHAPVVQAQLKQDQGRWQGWMLMATEVSP